MTNNPMRGQPLDPYTELELTVAIEALEAQRTRKTARKVPAPHASAVAMELVLIDQTLVKMRDQLAAIREKASIAGYEDDLADS